MMILAPAVAFCAVDDFNRGFRPWEKTILAALRLMPLIARSIAHLALVPLGVPPILAVFVLILRRSEAFDDIKLLRVLGRARNNRHDIAALKS